MIIPVRCFTCNNMVGDKWNPYIELVKREKSKYKNESLYINKTPNIQDNSIAGIMI